MRNKTAAIRSLSVIFSFQGTTEIKMIGCQNGSPDPAKSPDSQSCEKEKERSQAWARGLLETLPKSWPEWSERDDRPNPRGPGFPPAVWLPCSPRYHPACRPSSHRIPSALRLPPWALQSREAGRRISTVRFVSQKSCASAAASGGVARAKRDPVAA